MKKYLAVIHDSFREAFASRVLWILVALITVFLLAVAPLGYREELTWRLGDNDVRDWPGFMVQIRQDGPEQENTPTSHIWNRLDEELQERVTKVKIPGRDQEPVNPWEFLGTLSAFQKAVNKQLEAPDFFNEEAWSDVKFVSPELRELRDEGSDQLSDQERARFHRLLMEAAFPDAVRSSPPTSVQLTYFWYDVGPPQPLRGTNLQDMLEGSAAWLMKWFVGAVGIFVAVLVTAPVIPHMFDPGSLHLLLSKPISRWLLFLAKFFGGCAFILIGATYLIGGIWLVLGLRFGVWDAKLLLSIPIYLFVFAIYYSVSALTGVIWRSPVVCIGTTILFFLACWVIGTTKIGFESMIWNKQRIRQVVEAGDTLIGVDEMGYAQAWQEDEREWEEVFVSESQQQARAVMMFIPVIPGEFRPVGPVYDSENDRLLSLQPSFPPGKLQLCVGKREEEWESVSGAPAPAGGFALLEEPDKSILAVSSLGVHRLVGDPAAETEPLTLFGLKIPLTGGGPFRSVSDEESLVFSQPATATIDRTSGLLAVYSRGELTFLARQDDGQYKVQGELTLEEEHKQQPVVMALGGSTLLVGRRDGRIQVVDGASHEVRGELAPEDSVSPRFLSAHPDGRWFAIVLHNGSLWLYDAEADELSKPAAKGQGEISSAQFTADGSLLVAYADSNVARYQVEPWKLHRTFTPRLGILGWGYRYGLIPLYTAFPKPGELDKTFEYLLSGEETKSEDHEDLTTAQQKVDPWTPLWSSALFMVIVLTVACVYIEWQEF
jgi:ABC-type transport system involved in multi-copper enzyme maturation permease subunit